MDNAWVNKNLEVIDATPQKVDGFGFLYVFDCINHKKNGDTSKFLQISQSFLPYKLHLTPKNLYRELQNRNVQIIPLDRRQDVGKDIEWGIEQAIKKATPEQPKDEWTEDDYWNYKEEPFADHEYVSEVIRNKIDEWNRDANSKNNWYKSAKEFIRKIITGL